MEPLKKSNNVNASHGTGTPVVNKPGQVNRPSFKTNKAKKQVFGSPKKPKKNNKKKNKGGMPLPLKIGGGVAAGALAVGIIGYAMTNNHANNSASNKDNSTDSDLTGKGSDDGTNDLTKNKKKNSNNKKSKKSKKDGKETDLLNDILDGEGAKASGKHSSSKSSSSEELDSLIKSMGSDSKGSHKGGASLKQLAKKATESKAVAENLGGSKSSKISEKEKSRNEIGTEKKNTSELQQLANKNKNAKSVSSEPKIPGQSNITKGTTTNSKNTTHHNISTGTKGQPTTAPGHGHHGGGTQPTGQPTTAPGHGHHGGGTQPTSQPTTVPDHGHHGGGTQPTSQPTTVPDHGHHSGGTQPTSQPTTVPDHGHHGGGTQPTSQPTTAPDYGHHGGETQPTSQPTTAPDHGHHGGGTQPTGQPTTAPGHGHHGGGTQPTSQPTTVPDHGHHGGGTQPTSQPTTVPDHGHHSGGTQPTSQPTTVPDHGHHGGGTQPTSQPTTAPDYGHHGGETQPTSQPTTAPDHGHHGGGTQPTSQPTTAPDHGHHGGGTQSTTAPTPTLPYENVPDGTTKTVQFVDSDGKVVGTGELTKHGNGVSLNDIPSGYKLADEDANGKSAQLLQWPNQISVVSDGSQPTTKYPSDSVPDGTTKSIQFVDSNGKVVGTGELTKHGNGVSLNGIPSGYKLSDEDANGKSAQLLQWQNQIKVVSDGSQPATPTYLFEKVADGSSKPVTFVDSQGKSVGTGTITKEKNSVNINDIPDGYKLADLDSNGQSPQLLQWPDQISVVSDGSQSSQPTTPTYPFEKVADGSSKSVTFVDSQGKNVGTGSITRNGNGVNVSGIPGGYKLADEDSQGQSAQLLQWPNQISVVSDGSKSATPSYPAQSITNGTSKSVKFIDDSGKVVGTGTISKNGDSINVDGIPGGYELSDEGSQGQSAQLLQWPDQLSVVATGGAPSTNQSTGNSEGQLINGDASKTYPFEKVANGTTKDVSFVDSNGKVVGTGKLYKSNNSVSIDGIPGGYKLSDEDSQGQSAQLLDWPNKIVVVADGSSKPTTTYAAENIPDGTSKSVKYVDMNGNVLGTGTITKHGNGVSADGIPYGYKVAGAEGNQMNDLLNWSDQITLMPANSAIA
ncbi:hypothetical protein L2784_08200 [Lactobacillus crispatus]|uniref:hypothetical protein n=1 Tax=Lactobacillus crispatus TaxID=47770 RepID=UPI0022ABE214|nr:hypothetical protein [Lactobacillus crispatus]MCZ3644992.1 hypothetical protein [Lactobacillus crispatus]MCZ3647426.1 hypothetical protein [Lactobacillus crispatus]MCZ3656978.1 hypothetical protein [Lactobacillus crispatus]